MSRLKITSTCNGCGLSGTQEGDDAMIVMRAIQAAHDVLKPDCRYSTPPQPPNRCDETTRLRGGAARCDGMPGHVGSHRAIFNGDVIRWTT